MHLAQQAERFSLDQSSIANPACACCWSPMSVLILFCKVWTHCARDFFRPNKKCIKIFAQSVWQIIFVQPVHRKLSRTAVSTRSSPSRAINGREKWCKKRGKFQAKYIKGHYVFLKSDLSCINSCQITEHRAQFLTWSPYSWALFPPNISLWIGIYSYKLYFRILTRGAPSNIK